MRFAVVSILVLILTSAAIAEMQVYFAPKGGFAPINKNRAIVTQDGRQLAPTLNNAALELIDSTKPGGVIKIAMYAFSDKSVQESLIKAAFDRNVKVKVILDGVAAWTVDIRRDFIRRVKAARRAAPARFGKNFQIKVIQKRAFRVRGRTKRLRGTGEEIYGTMHEKFGVFYQPGMKIPFDCFGGSSNISLGSDQKFAENRFVFKDNPTVARQYAEEFARLWNEYGTDFVGNAESEIYIPAEPVVGGVKCIFNGEPINEESYHKIDQAIMDAIRRVRYTDGTIDIFMFSFTHWQIAQLLLEYAQRYPTLKIRILMDQTQLIADENHRGILGPYIEEQCEKLNIQGIEVRYKWRANVYGYEIPHKPQIKAKVEGDNTTKADPIMDGVPGAAKDEPKKVEPKKEEKWKVAQIHWRNLILHHKVIIVDRKVMLAGSYNWSTSAERRNLENVMVFNGKYPGHQSIVDRMLAEFDYLWNNNYNKPPFRQKITTPQVIEGPIGRQLTNKIIATMSKKDMKPIMEYLDKQDASFAEIVRATKLPADVVRKNLQELVQTGLLYNRRDRYGLAD